jgi:hypothetical protein
MATNWSYKFKVGGKNHAELADATLTAWHDYINDADMPLPWNTEVKISRSETDDSFDGEVHVMWTTEENRTSTPAPSTSGMA